MISFAQNVDHHAKFDSIIAEATILYNFEKTIWQSSDLLKKKAEIQNNVGGYIVYQEGNTIKNISTIRIHPNPWLLSLMI